MANPEQLEEQREETRLIIEELLEDGSLGICSNFFKNTEFSNFGTRVILC